MRVRGVELEVGKQKKRGKGEVVRTWQEEWGKEYNQNIIVYKTYFFFGRRICYCLHII
jgi:hypothetical protein